VAMIASRHHSTLKFFTSFLRHRAWPLTGIDTVRAANRALVGRPFRRPARVYPVEGR
jgi:hypothetical protein